MRCFAFLISFVWLFVSCKQPAKILKKVGYLVYILPNNVRFIETKSTPDKNYIQHFQSSNFLQGFSFEPNCLIENIILNTIPDTLFDEDTKMNEYATFLRKPLVFPCKIDCVDTTDKNTVPYSNSKFKMVYKGKVVEFMYRPFN